MSFSDPTRVRARSTMLAAFVIVGAAIIGTVSYQALATSPSSSAAPPPIDAAPTQPLEQRSLERLRNNPQVALGEADGAVPSGTTVFDNRIPGVAKLDSALLAALRRAATDAAASGITFNVNSGWRSTAYQNQLFREAVSEYGSEKEAARWVATADASVHVSGDAVDIGPTNAATWIAKHGAKYGLCQIYKNDPWHYELRPAAISYGCPHMYADPTYDPRMQQ
jgi:hypothetical protein